MNNQDLIESAEVLAAAYQTRVPISPLTETNSDLSVAEAYRIQQLQVERWCSAGRQVKGHKVGLTSKVMQRQLGVAQPDYGHLFADMFHLESFPLRADKFISPKVEPEIAFVLNRDLTGPGVTAADAVRAIDFVVPALEIIDSRIADWRITLQDTIADNASSGGVVLGSSPKSLRDVDLRLTGCVVHQGGRVVDTGAGAAVLGSPVNALVWLANTLGPLNITLTAGSTILPGSLTGAVPVNPDKSVTAVFAGLGSVTASFVSQENV